MASFMDLPNELLIKIFDFIGGYHLRRGKGSAHRLTVCRRWFAVAYPVFHRGMPYLDSLKFCGQEIKDFASASHRLRLLMYENTRELRIDVLEAARTMSNADRLPMDLVAPENQEVLEWWRDQVFEPSFKASCDDLPRFDVLHVLVIKANVEDPMASWLNPNILEYVSQSAIRNLLIRLPSCQSLQSLTLDINGNWPVRLDDDSVSSSPCGGICDELGFAMVRIKQVRLRLPRLCTRVLEQLEWYQTRPQEVRLESLTIQIGLPRPDYHPSLGSTIHCDWVQPAGHVPGHPLTPRRCLIFDLNIEAQGFLTQLSEIRNGQHGMKVLRLTNLEPMGPGLRLQLFDCLTKRMTGPHGEHWSSLQNLQIWDWEALEDVGIVGRAWLP